MLGSWHCLNSIYDKKKRWNTGKMSNSKADEMYSVPIKNKINISKSFSFFFLFLFFFCSSSVVQVSWNSHFVHPICCRSSRFLIFKQKVYLPFACIRIDFVYIHLTNFQSKLFAPLFSTAILEWSFRLRALKDFTLFPSNERKIKKMKEKKKTRKLWQ